MPRPQPYDHSRSPCEIIDFDEVLLDACPPDQRNDLLTEARILAAAVSPHALAQQLDIMAASLSAGARDGELGRAQARKLAAALKRVARERGP